MRWLRTWRAARARPRCRIGRHRSVLLQSKCWGAPPKQATSKPPKCTAAYRSPGGHLSRDGEKKSGPGTLLLRVTASEKRIVPQTPLSCPLGGGVGSKNKESVERAPRELAAVLYVRSMYLLVVSSPHSTTLPVGTLDDRWLFEQGHQHNPENHRLPPGYFRPGAGTFPGQAPEVQYRRRPLVYSRSRDCPALRISCKQGFLSFETEKRFLLFFTQGSR